MFIFLINHLQLQQDEAFFSKFLEIILEYKLTILCKQRICRRVGTFNVGTTFNQNHRHPPFFKQIWFKKIYIIYQKKKKVAPMYLPLLIDNIFQSLWLKIKLLFDKVNIRNIFWGLVVQITCRKLCRFSLALDSCLQYTCIICVLIIISCRYKSISRYLTRLQDMNTYFLIITFYRNRIMLLEGLEGCSGFIC
eukprot:TRINITY_DN17291_c0_g3_i10.p2 TRINITY_DN17291_c0_g3~~TRINITY_DN17291_c0_g3_i10.p2  ORF type:complete len:193 (+),score=1.45 TRINITY_DN17291_c0_g3_i10:148-726(+)